MWWTQLCSSFAFEFVVRDTAKSADFQQQQNLKVKGSAQPWWWKRIKAFCISKHKLEKWSAQPADENNLPRLPSTLGLIRHELFTPYYRTLYGDMEEGIGELMTKSLHIASESSPAVSSLAMFASCVGWTTSQYRPNALNISDTNGTTSDKGGGVVLQDLSDST